MTRRLFDIESEPAGTEWRALISTLAAWSEFVQLVVRDELPLSSRAQTLLDVVAPHLCKRTRSRSWPGTVLHDGEATVYRYTPQAVPLLAAAADGLFAWRQPDLPEDLALFRDDESLILGSIAHERDAWLELTDLELTAVERATPLLRLFSRP